MILSLLDGFQDLVSDFHRHAAEVGNKMRALSVTRETAFWGGVSNIQHSAFRCLTCAFLRRLPTKRQKVATVATPVRTHIREILEAMRDTVIELLLFRVRFIICFADTLRDHVWVAFLVAGVLAVGTLHTGRVFQEVSTQSASHDIVELLLDKLVAVHFMYFLLSLTDSSFTIKTQVNGSPIFHLFGCAEISDNLSRAIRSHCLPKLIVRCIRPAGSSANHASIITGFV